MVMMQVQIMNYYKIVCILLNKSELFSVLIDIMQHMLLMELDLNSEHSFNCDSNEDPGLLKFIFRLARKISLLDLHLCSQSCLFIYSKEFPVSMESQVVGLKWLEPFNEFVSVALEKPEVCRNILCF